jgi:hypothetical protein
MKAPKLKACQYLIMLCLGTGFVGCINPHTEIDLYFPRRSEAENFEKAIAPPLREARPVLRVMPIEDLRRWPRIGEVRSGLGFHVNVIESSEPPADWLTEGLSYTLNEMGYETSDELPFNILLEGKLRKLFVSKRFSYEAELSMLIVARCSCHRKILVTREFEQVAILDGEDENGFAEALAYLLEQTGEFIASQLSPIWSESLHECSVLVQD